MNIPDTIVGWQCIGCGRVDAPQPCIGVCQDRKVELVAAGDYLQLWERHEAALALLRQIAHVQPREGQYEVTWKALQAQARKLLEPMTSEA